MNNSEHILLAKDNEDYALLFKRALQAAQINASLEIVHDGKQAIDYLAGAEPYHDRQKHPFPKLLLLDLKMPRMDGFEVLSAIRQRLGFTQLPVIVLTHSDNPADVRRAYELGATSYFRKPDSLEGLDEMIHVLHAYWRMSWRSHVAAPEDGRTPKIA